HGAAGSLEGDAGALERLLTAVAVVTCSLQEPARVSALDVMRWPGVLREDSASSEEVVAAAFTVFAAALEELVAARAREGARLRELLEQRCTALEALIADVHARLPEVHAH